jgi:hypothetical protein
LARVRTRRVFRVHHAHHQYLRALRGAGDLGDLDSDGRSDLFVVSLDNDSVLWFRNTAGANGPAFFSNTVTDSLDGARTVFFFDVDNDGADDLAAGGELGNALSVFSFTGPPSNSFVETVVDSAAVTPPSGAEGLVRVVAADVDLDGDDDRVTATFGGSQVSWYENLLGEGGGFTKHVVSGPTSTRLFTSAFPVDIDSDGDVDTVAVDSDPGSVVLYTNDAVSQDCIYNAT